MDAQRPVFKGFSNGVNLGGWISQFDSYDEEHFDSFITEKDIKDISGMGFDHVRVPVDYIVLQDDEGNIRESGFRHLEDLREWCSRYGIKMIIDLHECYGYSFDPLKDMDRKKFFFDSSLQERFLSLWRVIAERFKDYPEEIAFEPLNEVVMMEVKDAWNDLASRYIKMMREIVPDSYLIIGGVCYNNVNTVKLLDVPVDDKIVYNFHCYDPQIFTHQGAYWMKGMPLDFRIGYPKTLGEYKAAEESIGSVIKGGYELPEDKEVGEWFFDAIFEPAIEKADRDGVALYCGEYGAIDRAHQDDRDRWTNDIQAALKKHGIGHALWNYKEKDFGLV